MMTKYVHCVFVRHEGSNKTYLFSVKSETMLRDGQEVLCETKYGESAGRCVGNSFCVSEKAINSIVSGVGAYMPLKDVVGTIEVESVMTKTIKRFDELPF